jgi:integrase
MRRAAETLNERRLAGVRVPTGTKLVELRDAATPGLAFRARASGWRGFVFRFTTAAGARRGIVLGPHGERAPALSLARARVRAGELRAIVRAGGDPLQDREAERASARAERAASGRERARARAAAAGGPLPGSFGELARVYLRDYRKPDGSRKRTLREDRRKLERDLLPAWRNRPSGEITRADVRALVAATAAGDGNRSEPGRPAPIAANRLLGLVSKLFNFAIEIEFPGVQFNPAHRLRKPGAELGRARVLSPAEILALWEATADELPHPRCAVRLLLLTGLRRSELLGASWTEITEDDLGLWLDVPASRSKNGRALRAPLSTFAREILEELAQVRHPELLFPGLRDGRSLYDLNGPMRRLRARVADRSNVVEPWVFHDLRRTFRTLLAELRVPFGIAERLLGHVAPEARGVAGVYDRYQYAPERMAAVETLARRVREIVSGERANVLPFYQRAEP